MPTVELKALTDFSYGTRRLKAGDTFTASARDAKILHAIGKASGAREPGKVPPPPPSLMTRAMTATPQREPEPEPEPEHAPPPPASVPAMTARDPLDHDGDGRRGGSKRGTRRRSTRKTAAKK